MSKRFVTSGLAAIALLALSAGMADAQNILLSGVVLTAEGNPPPQPVDIELVCNGNPQKQGQTNNKGEFSIQLGSQAYQSASDVTARTASSAPGGGTTASAESAGLGGGGLSQAVEGLVGCGLRAHLDGYISSVVELSGRRASDDPDVGTITITAADDVQGTTVSATSMNAPKGAKSSFDNGQKAFDRGNFDNAEQRLTKAVTDYPEYAEAWNALGMTQLRLKKNAEAIESFKKAVAADDKYLPPYLPLAQIAAQLQNWQEAADYSDTLTRLDPIHYPQAFYFNAVAEANLQNVDKAYESAKRCVALDTGMSLPLARQLLGLLQANRGEFAEAAVSLQSFIDNAPEGVNTDRAKQILEQVQQRVQAAPQQ